MHYKYLLLSIVLSIYSIAASAEGHFFRSVSNPDGSGMHGLTIYDIKQTADGFTWFASDRGLVRFDGEHVITVAVPEPEGGSHSVKAIAPLRGGSLLAGTTDGVFIVEPSDGTHKVTRLLDRPFSATSGVTVGDSYSLIGGQEGVVVYNHATREMWQLNISSDILDHSNSVIGMSAVGKSVYLLTKSGIYRFDMDTRKVLSVCREPVPGSSMPTAIAAVGNSLYIGSMGHGVSKVDLATCVSHPVFPFISGNVVTSLVTGNDGRSLYIGTDGGGVTKVDLSTGFADRVIRHNTSDPTSPTSNQVYSLLSDADGLLWIGYYQNGADYSPGYTGPFQIMDNPETFNTRGISVRALCIDGDIITIGTREGVVSNDKDGFDPWVIRAPRLRSEMVISLLCHDGKTYVGTYGGGLEVMDMASRTISDFTPGGSDITFRNGHIFALAADSNGDLWAGTNNGLYQFAGNNLVNHFKSVNSALPEGNVYGIFFDSEGKGWICTETGMCVYDPRRKTLRTDIFPASFPRNTRVRSVYEDSDRRLYFVPETGSLFSCGLDFSDLHTIEHPLLAGSDVKGVVEDADHSLWIATNRGVFRRDAAGHFYRFGLAAGLPSVSFLQAQPHKDTSGDIWFGNSAGLVKLTESDIKEAIERQQRLVPTAVIVNGRPFATVLNPDSRNGEYKISFKTFPNNIKIDFSTLSYTLDEPESYEYSLDGGEWERLRGEMSLTFYDLGPGSHKLMLRPVNDRDTGRNTTVMVLRLPYSGLWIAAVVLVVIILLLMGLLYYRNMRARREAVASDADTSDGDAGAAGEAAASDGNRNDGTAAERPKRKYAANPLTRSECRNIAQVVDEVMRRDKPYLNPDLKISDLASVSGVSSHKLSQFFNQYMGKTFYDYINSFRVEEFKRLVVSPEARSYTLSIIAEKSGFSSRASFFRYFKNAEGISPGEYMKGLNKGS